MASLVFDTYAYVKKLTDAGMPEAQASIIAHEQACLIEEQLATKVDLQHLELKLKSELSGMKTEIIKWVAGLLIAQAALVATLLKLFTGA